MVIGKETKSFYCEMQERANEEMQRNITQSVPLNKNNVNEEDQLKKKVVVEEFEGEMKMEVGIIMG